ncbi:MAG: type IV secretion system DNA-binding domain-containing protein [Patescibacteria group bacterium]|nr:type IV secretion system DNA-binding domain-containing protein [Patescibacteria group bacterium]
MVLGGIGYVFLGLLVVGWLVLLYLVFLWMKGLQKSAPVHRDEFDFLPSEVPQAKNAEKSVGVVAQTTALKSDAVLLSIEVPKENETTALAAELMFASLHGVYRPELDKKRGGGQEHISFELQAKEKSIRFFVWVPRQLQGYVEGQIYAQYPGVNVTEVRDYASADKLDAQLAVAGTELNLTKPDIFPIKSFESFDVDPLAGITATLSKLENLDQIWIQLLISPVNDSWRNRAIDYITAIKTGRKSFRDTLVKGLKGFASDVMATAVTGEVPKIEEKKVELAPGVEEALKRIEEKSTKLGFRTKIRLVAVAEDDIRARQRLDSVVGSFKQFNTTNLNGFTAAPLEGTKDDLLQYYASRYFRPDRASIMNVTELASIYHLPNQSVTTPHIAWAGSKKGEPPANLPLADEVAPAELTNLGVTDFRGSQEKFGIKIKDRRRHVYVIGKSGVGKSTLLENMTLDDIREKRGVAVVDPHGEYVDYILEQIPSYRVNDVIVFNPGDREFPIGFNILEVENPKYKVVVASGVVGVFKKIFGDSWGPRLEYWLSSAILALLDYPNATLMMVPRLFTDPIFREQVIEKIQDPVIKARWINEYNKLDQRQQNETISPILNKVGQFLSSSLVRNIVGQPKSAISMRKVMDEGKVLLIKLSKGLIGEDNAALLGALLITQIQMAAMSRADTTDQEQRKDFFLYVDEFQNFATDSFAAILSEARKYRLSLTLAHQYVNQLSETVAKAIFGNVGTLVSFRVGGEDAEFLQKEFSPVFDAQDLVNLDVFKIYLKLSIDGLTAGAFSATTLPPIGEVTGNAQKIVTLSRERYSKPVDFVEDKLNDLYKEQEEFMAQVKKPAGRSGGFGSGQSRPAFSKPTGEKKKPDTDGLSKLISNIERKKGTQLPPGAKQDLSKQMMQDLQDETGSMKDALEQARKKKEEGQSQSGDIKLDEFTDLE